YDMVFVPFTDSGLLLREDTEAYTWLLSKDEDNLAKFVEQLKTIKKEVDVQVPKPPS
ncbi:hypothetical protein Tco_0064298, partial [Tanacetum coccineum]